MYESRKVKKTYSIGKKIDFADMDNEFKISCYKGNLKMSKLLMKLKPNIDISMNDEFVFRYSCNKITMLKWLLKIKPIIHISVKNNEVFTHSIYLTQIKTTNYCLQNKPKLYYIFEQKYNTFITKRYYKIYDKKQQMAKM